MVGKREMEETVAKEADQGSGSGTWTEGVGMEAVTLATRIQGF